MALMSDNERRLVEIVSSLSYGNPFLPERMELEKQALGNRFQDTGTTWHAHSGYLRNPNLEKIIGDVEALAAALRERRRDIEPTPKEAALYQDLIHNLLFNRYDDSLLGLMQSDNRMNAAFYARFRQDMAHFLPSRYRSGNEYIESSHLFACFYQLRRAFTMIFQNLIGGSMPTARQRAEVWQSVFTRDLRRYQRSLYKIMGNITTLITGPSGTGKELVARAIGFSRFIPFDEKREAFLADYKKTFYPLNLTALSPTLIESELFGHRRGAFTGALQDRAGWLEVCPESGTVFLDEIGEVDTLIQVKLLRVLQSRSFQRLGDVKERSFAGKVIAATNRNLSHEMKDGRFREDFFYRLCSDMIVTPSLREQLNDSPGELNTLLVHIAARVADEVEAEGLAKEAETWIQKNLGPDYAWPGNVRELEQCVRNIMIRGSYKPRIDQQDAPKDSLKEMMEEGRMTADALLRHYCTLVYRKTGSYLETARRLDLDRRTVKSKVDHNEIDNNPS